jgi:Fe2+ or Zn2+ uptake regulation protein
VLKRLQPFLQQELGFQLSAATKNASMLVSREMENLLQFTMVQGMGAATWETVLHRIQAKTIETLAQAWYNKLEHLVSAGIVKDVSDMAFPTMVSLAGS